MSFNFEKLKVFDKAERYACRVYKVTDSFPKEEIYGIVAQIRRAAVSISLNIAEGSSMTKKDFKRFIDISRGSVFENVALIRICLKLEYIKQQEFDELEGQLEELSKMLSGLKKTIY